MMLAFNEPTYTEKGIAYIAEAILKNKRLNESGYIPRPLGRTN